MDYVLVSLQRILTGFKQRNMFLNKHQIIHSWLDFIRVSKLLAGTCKEIISRIYVEVQRITKKMDTFLKKNLNQLFIFL